MPSNARGTGPLTHAVAAEIRSLMGARGMKQAELVTATGIPKATVSSILGERTAIDLEQIALIAEALEVEPDALIRAGIARNKGEEQLSDIYLPDGSLNPERVQFTRTDPAHLEELVEHLRKQRDNG